MIEGYVGLPGSGKTYTLTRRGLDELKAGHRVFSNYPIEGVELFGPADLLDLPAGFIIVDEAHLWLSSRAFHKLPHSWLVKISQTRKAGWHLLWSAQHPMRVDKALRDVTNVLHWCHCWPNAFKGGRPRIFWDNAYEPHVAQNGDPRDPQLQLARRVHWFSKATAAAYDTFGAVAASDHMEGDVYSEASKRKRAEQEATG